MTTKPGMPWLWICELAGVELTYGACEKVASDLV